MPLKEAASSRTSAGPSVSETRVSRSASPAIRPVAVRSRRSGPSTPTAASERAETRDQQGDHAAQQQPPVEVGLRCARAGQRLGHLQARVEPA